MNLGQSFRDYLPEAGRAAGSGEYRRDLAYWREVLHDAPALAHVPGRRRAAAIAGLGRNRGTMGFVHARLAGAAALEPELLRHGLMAAYVQTLAETFSLDGIVIDRWFTERSAAQPAGLLGPFDSFYPVVIPSIGEGEQELVAQVSRADTLGSAHRGLDAPGLELALEDWLRERGIALRQFGFAFLDAEQACLFSLFVAPLDAIAATLHEIQLAAAVSGHDLELRLAVDLDVVSKEQAGALFDGIAARLGHFTGAALAEPGGRRWLTRDYAKFEEAEATPPMPTPQELTPEQLANVERKIPLTGAQAYFNHMVHKPSAIPKVHSLFIIGKEFIIRPRMDRERLKGAVDQLVSRHEAMRTRFYRKEGGYGAYLERKPSRILFFEEVADEAAARQRADELAQETIRITDPMFRITVIRFGDEGDLLVAKAHHLVVDGYALGLIVEEFFKAYVGLPLPEVGMDIDTYLREFEHLADREALARRDAFLRKLFADPPPVPNIGRTAKGLPPNHNLADATIGRMVATIGGERHQSLRRRAKAAGSSESAMVMAAFARTICERGGVDEAVLDVPVSMRHDHRLRFYVNSVAAGVPVRVRPSAYSTLDELAAAISDGIATALPYAPFTDILNMSEFRDDLIAKGGYASLFLAGDQTSNRWVEDTLSAPLQRPFATGEIDMGMYKVTPLHREHSDFVSLFEIAVRSFPTDDGLGVGFNYDKVGFDEVEAEAFLQSMIAHLEEQ